MQPARQGRRPALQHHAMASEMMKHHPKGQQEPHTGERGKLPVIRGCVRARPGAGGGHGNPLPRAVREREPGRLDNYTDAPILSDWTVLPPPACLPGAYRRRCSARPGSVDRRTGPPANHGSSAHQVATSRRGPQSSRCAEHGYIRRIQSCAIHSARSAHAEQRQEGHDGEDVVDETPPGNRGGVRQRGLRPRSEKHARGALGSDRHHQGKERRCSGGDEATCRARRQLVIPADHGGHAVVAHHPRQRQRPRAGDSGIQFRPCLHATFS